MGLVDVIKKKLDEYGVEIYDEYPTKTGDEYIIYIEEAILFLNEKEFSLSISFQATTKPEDSSSLTLILREVVDITINLMESFIFNDKNEFICGDEAYKLIENHKKMRLLTELTKDRVYSEILQSSQCYEC